METPTSIPNVPAVYMAIAKVCELMSEHGIGKDKRNAQQGYNFRGIDDVLNALSSALVASKLVILPRCVERTQVERTTSKGGAIFFTTVRVEFDLVCTVDGSVHTVSTYGEAQDSADKSTNKAMSAAYKYLSLLTFCIPTEATPATDADFGGEDVRGQAMSARDRAEWIHTIDSATDMEALKKAHGKAVTAARRIGEAGDHDAIAAFESAKDKRKGDLQSASGATA